MHLKFVKYNVPLGYAGREPTILKMIDVPDHSLKINEQYATVGSSKFTHRVRVKFELFPRDATELWYEFETPDEKQFRLSFSIEIVLYDVYGKHTVSANLFLMQRGVADFG